MSPASVMTFSDHPEVGHCLRQARAAQAGWACTRLADRLALLRRIRNVLAEQASAVAAASAAVRQRPTAEALVAEVLPLAEAIRFLEEEAPRILRARRLGGRGRPLLLGGVRSVCLREPRGVVLIIAPGNYPLLLPGVQAFQALAAGNAVLIKPAPAGKAAALALARVAHAAGLDPALLQILPDATAAAETAIASGVDKIVLTGSAETGKAVLASAASQLTPTTMELSGCDAAVINGDADLDLAADALAFGLRLNAGATCIAPRRVLVPAAQSAALAQRLTARLHSVPRTEIPARQAAVLAPLVQRALDDGARLLAGELVAGGHIYAPLVLADVPRGAALLRHSFFAPVLFITAVEDEAAAVTEANRSPYALGASVFGRDVLRAQRLADQLNAGLVTINDVIAPTADPRLPFGGRGRSGFGVTRGPEGLLDMTVPKVVTVTRGSARRHFAPLLAADEDLFAAFIAVSHGRGLAFRWRALKRLVAAGRRRLIDPRSAHPIPSPVPVLQSPKIVQKPAST